MKLIHYNIFAARQKLQTRKVRGFALHPSEANKHGCIAIDQADTERRRFLTCHFLERSIDEECRRRRRNIEGMRSNSRRIYEFETPAEWLSRDTLTVLCDRILSAAYGLRKLGQPNLAEVLGEHYTSWVSEWNTMKECARSVNKRSYPTRINEFDALLDCAELLLAKLENTVLDVGDAANFQLYPHGVTRNKEASSQPWCQSSQSAIP